MPGRGKKNMWRGLDDGSIYVAVEKLSTLLGKTFPAGERDTQTPVSNPLPMLCKEVQ